MIITNNSIKNKDMYFRYNINCNRGGGYAYGVIQNYRGGGSGNGNGNGNGSGGVGVGVGTGTGTGTGVVVTGAGHYRNRNMDNQNRISENYIFYNNSNNTNNNTNNNSNNTNTNNTTNNTNNNIIQDKKKDISYKQLVDKENLKSGKGAIENRIEEKNKHISRNLKKEIGIKHTENFSYFKNNLMEEKKEESMKLIKEDMIKKNNKKEMLKLEEIEKELTCNIETSNNKSRKNIKETENEVKKEEENSEEFKFVSTQKLLNLLIKKVNGTLYVDEDEHTKKELSNKTNNKIEKCKQDVEVKEMKHGESIKMKNVYAIEQLEQNSSISFEKKKKQKNDKTVNSAVIDNEVNIKKKMGEEILNMINKDYLEQRLNTERGISQSVFMENGLNVMHSHKMEECRRISSNNRTMGFNKSANAHLMLNNVIPSNKNNSMGGYLERNAMFRNNKKNVSNGMNSTNVEGNNRTKMLKNLGEKLTFPNNTSFRDIDNNLNINNNASINNNVSPLKGIASKTKSLKFEKQLKKKKSKDDSSLFVMPVFMRSPEPEQIPIPFYLSDGEKDKDSAVEKDNCVKCKEKSAHNKRDVDIDIEENVTINKNGEKILTTKGTLVNNKIHEDTMNFGSNSSTDVKISSNITREKSIKDILNFHLNKKNVLNNAPRKKTEKIMKKNNVNNVFSNYYFNKETNKNGKYDNLVNNGNGARNSKKKYKFFNSPKLNEVGTFNTCKNNSFNQNKNPKHFKVYKYLNTIKYKTRGNFYDGQKWKHLNTSNDVKIAVY